MTLTPSHSALFYDGQSAAGRTGQVEAAGGVLFFVAEDQRYGPFLPEDIRHLGSAPGTQIYGHKGRDGWRLRIDEPIPEAIVELLPAVERYGGWIDRLGLAKASGLFLACSALVMLVILTVPEWLAPLIPHSVERNIGAAMVGDFGGRYCRGKKGQAALAALTRKLDKGSAKAPERIDVMVADIDMINAVALPGGQIIIFRGLIDEARSPDEVAGVLAHEIGHVRERHVMKAMLRQLGLSVLLSGSDIGATAGGILSLGYSRDAEGEADAFSIARLENARISPAATADFFDRLAEERGETPGWVNYMVTHPQSAARRNAFRRSERKTANYRSALDADEWNALRNICPSREND